MYRKTAASVALLLICCVLSSCHRDSLPEHDFERVAYPGPTAAPLLVIGVDGLEWNVILTMLRDGSLPHLARLMRQGVYGRLNTLRNPESPIVWTSVATGKIPAKHGIVAFTRRDEKGNRQLYSNGDRKTKALWNILSDYGKRVAVIGWWMTYPVEEINGIMVAQTNTLGGVPWKGSLIEGLPGQVWPLAEQSEMMALFKRSHERLPDFTNEIFGPFPYPLTEMGKRLWADCQWSFRADATYLSIARRLLESEKPFDLMMVYFGGPDVVGHRFWRYMQPELYDHPPSQQEIENFGDVITDYYAYIDRSVGALTDALGPDASVMIISDHGMQPHGLKFDAIKASKLKFSGYHFGWSPGVIIVAGSRIRHTPGRKKPEDLRQDDLQPLGSIYDIAPTILTWMRIPLGRDMDGRPLAQLATDDFDISNQPESVSTHDTRAFLASRPTLRMDAASHRERLEQLRSLGYIN